MSASKQVTGERRTPSRFLGGLALGVPAFVFTLLAIFSLGRRPMWRDETATREFASLSFSQLASAVSHVDLVMAPYYAVMHVVDVVSPHTESFRAPSAIAAIATMLFVGAAIRTRWGLLACLVSGSFLAINATFLGTATTARAYAIAAMFIACAMWVPTSRLRDSWVGIIWAVSASLAVLMQLFSVLVVPALVLALLPRKSWRSACAYACMPIGCAFAILIVTHHQSSQVGWIRRLSFDQAMRQTSDAVAVWSVAMVVLVVLLAAILQLLRRDIQRNWCMWLLATVLPPLALWCASEVTNPVFLMRYAVYFIPGLAGLLGASAGVLLDRLPGTTVRAVLGLCLVVLVALNGLHAVRGVLGDREGEDATATLPRALAHRVHVGDVVIYEASHAAGGQIYGWALYGHDLPLQLTLLKELPHGKGAMLQQRRVVSLRPFTTEPASTLAPPYVGYQRFGG